MLGCAVAQCCHCYSPLIGTGLPSSCRKNFCAGSAKGSLQWEFCGITVEFGAWSRGWDAAGGHLGCYINASTAQLTPACVSSSLNNLLPVVLMSRNCWEHLPHLPLIGQHPRGFTGQSLKWAQLPSVLSGLGTCSVVIYRPSGDEQSEDQYVLHFPPFNILTIMGST